MSGATDSGVALRQPMSGSQVLEFSERIRRAHQAGVGYSEARILFDSGLLDDLFKAVRHDPDWLQRPETRELVREALGLNRLWIDFDEPVSVSAGDLYEVDVQPDYRVRGRCFWDSSEFDIAYWTGNQGWQTGGTPPGKLWPVHVLKLMEQQPNLLPEEFRKRQIWFWTPLRQFGESSYVLWSLTYRDGKVVPRIGDYKSVKAQPHWVAIRKAGSKKNN